MTKEEFNQLDHLTLKFKYRNDIRCQNGAPGEWESNFGTPRLFNIYDKDAQMILTDAVGPSDDVRKLIGITNFINLINEGYVELVLGATDIRNNKLKELTNA